MNEAYDQNDLLRLSSPQLQNSLLKITDELLAQATLSLSQDVCDRLLTNLSKRRRSDIRRLSASLEASGEISDRAAKAALHNLVRQIFEIAGTEPDGNDHSERIARMHQARRAGDDEGESSAPKLTKEQHSILGEARKVISSFDGMSGYSKHLKTCREGMGGAVLLRAWLGKKPALSRDTIYDNICGRGRYAPGKS